MQTLTENRRRSNLLLVIAIIAASILVIWVIVLFDKMDDSSNPDRSTNKQIKQTITVNHTYNVYDLLQIKKNYT